MNAQIVKQSMEGDYGLSVERVLAIDTDTGLGILIEDTWSGRGSPEGETYRPYLHTLTVTEARHVQSMWDHPWADMYYNWPEPARLNSPSHRYYGEPIDALRRHVARNEARRARA